MMHATDTRLSSIDVEVPTDWLYCQTQLVDACFVQHQSCKTIARYLLRKIRLLSIAVLLGLVFPALGNLAHASSQTTILDYICITYESARHVALEQGWESPESMPGDCRTLFQRPFELRVAEICQIMEIVQIGNGRWIEIGRVRRSWGETGYSAGIADNLLLF